LRFYGFIIGVVIWFLLMGVIYVVGSAPTGSGISAFVVISMIAIPYIGSKVAPTIREARIREQEARQRVEADRQNKLLEIEHDKRFCRDMVASSSLLAQQLPNCLRNANDWLGVAEKEFAEHAYAPYWDAIESAAVNLGDYDAKIKQIRQNQDSYNFRIKALQKSKSSGISKIPPFAINLSRVPSPQKTADHFTKVARRGLTDRDFAVIYESRMTRKVLISGFQTLGEAVKNLSYEVNSAFSNLRNTI